MVLTLQYEETVLILLKKLAKELDEKLNGKWQRLTDSRESLDKL